MEKSGRRFSGAAVCAIMLASPMAAMAQRDNSTSQVGGLQIETIVVTAQRREENLQDVPVSVTALGSDTLKMRGIDSILDLAGTLPGIMVGHYSGVFQPFARGVGNASNAVGNEPSVATYIDGVYFPRVVDGFAGLRNVERVEVLKGPQGTLFGRNASAGVVQIITRDPSYEPSLSGSIGYGRFDAVNGDAYITGGLTDNLAVDLAVSAQTSDGFGENLTTGGRYGYTDSVLVRSKLLFEPSETTRFVMSGFYSESDVSGQKCCFPGTTTGTLTPPVEIFTSEEIGFYNEISDHAIHHKFTMVSGSFRAEVTADPVVITSITGYSHLKQHDFFDGEYGPRPDFTVDTDAHVKVFSQEFQLSSISIDPLEWIAGLYYYHNKSAYTRADFRGVLFGPGLNMEAEQQTESYAAFAQATYQILPQLSLTGGVRYTQDKMAADGILKLNTTPPIVANDAPPGSEKIEKVTWRGALEFQALDDIMIYGSVSRSFKSGNFNLLIYTEPTPTRPEVLDAYEIGFKSDFLDQRIRLNGALFYYDIKNPQVQLIRNDTIFFSNAGGSRVKGAELEGTAILTRELTGRFAMTYLDSEYTDYPDAPTLLPNMGPAGGTLPAQTIDARGNRTPFASEFTANVGLDYEPSVFDEKLLLSVDFFYNDGYFFQPDNFLHQGSYGLLDAQVRYSITDQLAIRIWGENLTDEKVVVMALAQEGVAGYVWTPGAPLTYGIALDFQF